jgi:hypothetical protein
MTDAAGPSESFFYGLRPRWWSWDRFYRIYVGDRTIAGAYVAGQFYDHVSAAVQLQQLRGLAQPFVRKLMTRRRDREVRYDCIDPFGPSLLDQDPRNFQWQRSDVVRTRFRRNRSRWTPFNVGSVEFDLRDGTSRRFILAGDQPPDRILDLIRRFDPDVEVLGKPNPLPGPHAIPRAHVRAYLFVMAAGFLGVGAVLEILAHSALKAERADLMPAAIPLIGFGTLFLIRAWRLPTGPSNDASRIREDEVSSV